MRTNPLFRRWRLLAPLLFCTSIAFATSRTILDIQGWKHPAKAVFLAWGVDVERVSFLDEVTPRFHVSLPLTAATCTEEGRRDLYRELARANGFWSFRILDSSRRGLRLDAAIQADPKTRSVLGSRELRAQPCPGPWTYRRDVPLRGGRIAILDRSPSSDTGVYLLRWGSRSVRIVEGSYALESARDVTPAGDPGGPRLVLLNSSGPGLHCHDRHRLVEVAADSSLRVSPSFGHCTRFGAIRRRGDTLELRMLHSVNDQTETFLWKAGRYLGP